MRLDTTDDLAVEISKGSDVNIKPIEMSKGRYGGNYAVKDLALIYAMWISSRFHLEVLRGFKEPRRERMHSLREFPERSDARRAIIDTGMGMRAIRRLWIPLRKFALNISDS